MSTLATALRGLDLPVLDADQLGAAAGRGPDGTVVIDLPVLGNLHLRATGGAPSHSSPVMAAGPGTDAAQRPAVVVLQDWTRAQAEQLSQAAYAGERPVLPVRLDGGLVLIGPLLHRAAPVCLGCAEGARLSVFGPTVPQRTPGLAFGGLLPPTLLAPLAALLAGALADPAAYEGTVLALRADRLTVSTHRVRAARQGCAVCSPLPDDTAQAARITLTPSPTADPYAFRAANERTTREGLRAELFDWRHGPVAHLRRTENMPLPLVTAELAGDSAIRESGYGRARTFADAERVGLFEAAERYTGMRPHGRRTAIMASYAELDPATTIDPARLGLQDPAYHDHPEFKLKPYTPDLRTGWVHGWSLTRDRLATVPEHVAYWGLHAGAGPRFLYESSNGCGLGNSLTEAVLYGLYEVAERDAFLMAWYARTPLRRVAVPADDPVLPHLTDRLEQAGYRLMFFDATNDFGVPTVLALVLHHDPVSGAPQALFAAGAHPDPRAAMRSAAAEAVVDAIVTPDVVRAKPHYLDRARLLPMLDDPELVLTLDDHVALNTLPEARERYDFLLGDDDPDGGDDWREVWPGAPAPAGDLTVLLADTLARLDRAGLEVVAVDQTDPRLRDRLGLHSAKVIVPGSLPMTFGHLNHRTRDLPRLLEVPFRLGRATAPLRYDDLARHPHPFP
ncbi:TOMM precursor leader peptide-binding protein [Catellatospora sp. NPDC049133]|uniref:TOMM precursor leader peptide-binding protein n=1 Tax=Catellatospora sp. NPDC049133 TaxID=3155499 RepID=UPI0033C61EFC